MYFTGADFEIQDHLTIYNIFRFIASKTGQKLLPGSRGANTRQTSMFNVAKTSMNCRDLTRQAEELCSRMEANSDVKLNEDWKMIALWIGTNDTPIAGTEYKAEIEKSLGVLKSKLPRTIVMLIGYCQPELLLETGRIMVNGKRPNSLEHQKKIDELTKAYQNALFEIQNERKFNDKQFTVVVQPFMTDYKKVVADASGAYKKEFYANDNFHMSKLGQAIIAKHLWQNMFEPVGRKTTNAPLEDWKATIHPLNRDNSLIRTVDNSGIAHNQEPVASQPGDPAPYQQVDSPTNSKMTHVFSYLLQVDETANLTIDDASRMNSEWTARDTNTLTQETCEYEGGKPFGWCKHTGLNPSNKHRIMVIGNSWVANHGRIIYEECGGKANTLVQGSAYGCEALYPSIDWPHCPDNFTHFEQRVKDFKPDYLFHLTRHISYGNNPFSDFKTDPIYRTMLTQLNKMTKYVQNKFYILDAIPWIDYGYLGSIVSNIKNNNTVEFDKKLTDMTNFDRARKRYAQLFKDCGSKCERIDYHNLFYKNETSTFRFYDDRGFSYITGQNHISPHGLEHVRLVYRDICNRL